MADALSSWSMAALYRGDLAAARARQEESLALRSALGHRSDVALSQQRLGLVALYEGNLAQARAAGTRSGDTSTGAGQARHGLRAVWPGTSRLPRRRSCFCLCASQREPLHPT